MSQRYIGGLIYNPPGGFSGYFDPSGDYLTATKNAAYEIGSGDFTVEAWIFPTEGGSLYNSGVFSYGASSSLNGYLFGITGSNAGGTLNRVMFEYNYDGTLYTSTSGVTLNAWNHIAVSRSGSNIYVFLNGNLQSTTSTSKTANTNAGDVSVIGSESYDPGSTNRNFRGYISNLRLVKGTAVYTASFDPPNGPLQAITNTSLLTCAYSTFRDGSTNNFTITVNGNTAVSTQNPFPLTTLPNPALGNQGNGVYTMSQYQSLLQQNLWPAVDPYWEYVTLMLHGNGTNGAQNNTFLDSSTNNFTITRNGNTTQGAFSPYGDNWSNYFDGSGDYLSAPDNAAFELGSGDFTIECWVNFNSLPASNGHQATFVSKWATNNASYEFYLYNNAGTQQLYLTYSTNGTASTNLGVNWTPATGVWYHIACVRNGGNLTFWVNGTQQGATQSISGTFFDGSAGLEIGGFVAGSANTVLNGYLSNVRLLKGTALYTSAFTPSTAPLTAITNTSLLTCQSNRFIDNSSNNFTITRNGDVRVQRFSPFHPTAPYAAGTIGGSGYFDGSGDYLTVASNAAFNFGTGDFTVEAWVYFNSASGTQVIFDRYSASTGWQLYVSGSKMQFYVDTGFAIAGVTTLQSGQWYHVLVARSGTSMKMFLNGVQEGTTATSTTNFTSSTPIVIGSTQTPGGYINGFLGDARILKGTAAYTSAFTPPTAPLTAITNTSLLLNFTNGGIIDNAMMNDLETVGNAQISTSVSKFGGGSLAFDGSGDYLSSPQSQNYSFGTGDFTIEGWIYLSSNTGAYRTIVHIPHSSGSVLVRFGSSIDYSSYFQVSTLATSASNVYSTNQNQAALLNKWVHFAFTRSSSTCRVFLDGVQQNLGTGVTPTSFPNTSFSDSTNIVNNSAVGIGDAIGNNIPFIGYIDDLRITKYARYTANFTPQRSQWQDQ